MSDTAVKWQPSSSLIEQSNLRRFARLVAAKVGRNFDDYSSLHRWSVEAKGEFWQLLAEFTAIQFSAPAVTILDESAGLMRQSRWFVGAKLNYARELMGQPNDDLAIISFAEGEAGPRSVSRKQLWRDVAALTVHLNSLGLRLGDRVAGVVANTYETVVAMLATTALGGIWSSCSPDFGTLAVLDRFGQLEPRFMFYTRSYVYGGKRFDCSSKMDEVIKALPSLVAALPLDQLPQADPAPDMPTIAFVETEFDHPLFIMFSSGTTGIPKGIVHATGRTLLQHQKEHLLHVDLKPKDRIFYFTTCGWMMWNWLVSALSCRATIVVYDGSVNIPTSRVLWDFVAEHQVNVFGTSPKYLQLCINDGVFLDSSRLAKLDRVLSTGSPLLPEQFDWVYQQLGERIQLSSISGGTDIISCFMLGNPWTPVRRGEIQAAGLGMDIAALNELGEPVLQEKGELACLSPFVSMPIHFWRDADGAKYRSAYFGKYSDRDVWCHGDFVEITANGGVVVYGRSDATLNPGGVRIGTAEIYRVVEAIAGVQDSLAIGREVTGDVEVVLFVKTTNPDWQSTSTLIRQEIRRHLSPRHVPARLYQVRDIPYTRSGKKVELAVHAIFSGRAVTNSGALSNPESLREYHDLARQIAATSD